MFARVMMAVDEDIISLDIPRSASECRRSMAFKDAMRVRDVADVIHACTSVVKERRYDSPELVRMVLATLQRYIDWVDIQLVATAEFTRLLYTILRGTPIYQSARVVLRTCMGPCEVKCI
jgi:exportin-T